jgi:hypothetical protein
MISGYAIIAIGLSWMFFMLSQAHFARENGYMDRITGQWIPPTDRRAIKQYVKGKYAASIVGLIVVAFGLWAVLSPQTLIALLPR